MGIFRTLYSDHAKEELIRTVDSIINVVLQLITLGVQVYGLWWLTHHSHFKGETYGRI